MTSYHDVTKPDLPISACRCPRKMIIFLFPCFWVTEFKTVNDFLFILCRHVMTSCHDVTKSASSISACGWARTMILFMFPWFNWLLISRMLSFMYFCDDITS